MAQLDLVRSANYDYSMKTGVTFLLDIVIKQLGGNPVDLTGYTVKLYIYNYLTKIGTVNGTITDAPNGKVHFEMSATDTALMPLGNYIYHMEYSISGVVTRLAEGKIEIRD